MKKKLLINELNRMREMMSLPIISETRLKYLLTEGDGTKGLSSLGLGPKSIDNLTKSGIDAAADLSKLSDEFVTLTGKQNPTMDDFLKIVSDGLGKNSDELTDAEVEAFVKNNEKLYDSILKKAADEAAKIVDELMKNLSLKTLFDDAKIPQVYENLKVLVSTPPTKRNVAALEEDIDNHIDFVDELLKDNPGNKELIEIAQQLNGKKMDIKKFNEVSTSSPANVSSKVSDEPTGFKGQKDFVDFSKSWTRQDVEGGWDQNKYAVINSNANEAFTNLPTQFDPSQIKLGRTNTYEFIGRNGELRERTQIEVTLPNGKKTLMYSSSGANEATTGKKAGEWFWIPGFAKNGWYIKETESVAYTKGGNKYMTDFAKFLENNGYSGLGQKSSNVNQPSKIVTPQNVSSNKLEFLIGDTSRINWDNITNAKDVETYNKYIEDAMNTNDYTKISRSGFEAYGIPNFRTWLMDKDLNMGDVSSDMLQGDDIYLMNRQIYDLYAEEGNYSQAFYDWFETLPYEQEQDLYKYMNSKNK